MRETVISSEQAPVAQSAPAPREAKQGVQLSLTVAFLILGALLAAQVRTQQAARAVNTATTRAVQEQLGEKNREIERLTTEVRTLHANLEQYRKAASEQNRALAKDLQTMKVTAGLMPVKGPGVVVFLNDKKAPRPEDQQFYIVHDNNILDVVNELRNAGAEAVAVNRHRLSANSWIRCVGSIIRIDDASVVAPYKVEAIGNPEALMGALTMPGGILENLNSTIIARTTQQGEITLPAAPALPSPKFAKPISNDPAQPQPQR